MRNRAKCVLCEDILESFHTHDYVTCKCGEISIDGGQNSLKTSAKNYENFLRLDDHGKEIKVTVLESHQEKETQTQTPLTVSSSSELIDMLDSLGKSIEGLPKNAMTLPITHYDYYSLIILLVAILKSKD